MERVFAHTPYDGRAKPFSIGLKPIPAAMWIVIDERRHRDLREKERLLADHRDVVLREERGTWPAQTELLALLRSHLATDHGFDPGHLVAEPGDDPPLVTAARLVQDDLVLMRRGPEGWRIAAACLCFPSTWSLAEKFGQPMAAIHEAVPGFAGQMAERIDRIFDRLPADQIVERLNWSIYADDRLHHPESKSGPRPWQGLGGRFAEQAFVRVERQTLRRLPLAGDIVFTIKVDVDPVSAFRSHPNGCALARGLHDQLAALTPEQLAYKNMLADRDILLQGLASLGEPG